MKKYLFILVGMVLFLSFSSCTDSEDIDITYDSTISLTAAQLFASYTAENQNDFTVLDGWTLHVYSYVYNMEGNLVGKYESSATDLSKKFSYNVDLATGKYKVISICSFSDPEQTYWTISDIEKLSTLNIVEKDEVPYASVYETLGYSIADLEIGTKSTKLDVSLTPLTSLVQIEFHLRDIVKKYDGSYGFRNQYSDQLVYTIGDKTYLAFEYAQINQKANYNVVRFPNGEPEFSCLTQQSNYPVVGATVESLVSTGNATIYAFRAFLPQKDKDFSWQMAVRDMNDNLISEESTTTSSQQGFLQIESGKQYDLDLFFDVLYLGVGEHNSSLSQEARLNRIINFVDPTILSWLYQE